MYVLQLIDNYAATYSLLLIALFECTTLVYIYGEISQTEPQSGHPVFQLGINLAHL